jgi:hypothetical protein
MSRRTYHILASVVLPLLIAVIGGSVPAAAQTSASLTVANYRVVSKKSAKQGLFDFTYAVDIVNAGSAVSNVSASLSVLVPNVTVMDGTVNFGNVPGGATVTGLDTFTIRHANRDTFSPSWLAWNITATASNRAPTAVLAPPTGSLRVGTVAMLDATGSSDPDGDVLTFAWALITRPAGSTASITGTTAQATLLLDRPGTYEARVTVSDGQFSDAVTVSFPTANTPPVADAGDDQTAAVGGTVSLDGTRSSDVDGDLLAYRWRSLEVPIGSAAVLRDPNTPAPSFTVDLPGSYTFELVVTDAIGAASTADVVAITTINSAPLPNAGPDQTVQKGDLVVLDGTMSTDVDGDVLTFSWAFESRPAGSTATLTDATTAQPTFVADAVGDFLLRLTVSDGALTRTDTARITTLNTAPVAHAGPDQFVPVNTLVSLDGSASTDVNGDVLSYAWALVSVPAGSTAQLSDATALAPTFLVDIAGSYVVQLIVHDGVDFSNADQVIVSTVNSVPVANAGPDQSFVAGQTVTLDGSGSRDADGNALTYEWSLIGRPTGSTAVLQGATGPAPTFVADQPGMFTAQLIVRDGTVASAPDTVVITSTNATPVADAGPDQPSVVTGATVTLDGSGSADADGHTLTYAWALITTPTGSVASLAASTTAAPTFTADLVGEYVAQLIVFDGFVTSQPDTVRVTVASGQANRKPIAEAGEPQSADAPGATVQLDGRASTDPDGDPLTYQWEIVSAPAGSAATLSDQSSSQPTMVVDLPGVYLVQLVVSDGTETSDPDQVVINGNAPPVAVAGATQVVLEGSLVRLDGRASYDPDPNFIGSCPADDDHPNELRWQWILNTRPTDSAAHLLVAEGGEALPEGFTAVATPVFVADVAGIYRVQLVVNDCIVNSESSLVQVRTFNTPPVANAGPDQRDVLQGATVLLDGSGSADPDGDHITYRWAFRSVPLGSTAVVFEPAAARPTFIVDVLGRYVIDLVVTDDFGAASVVDSVVITTPNRPPTANAGADRVATVNVAVAVTGSGSDPDNDVLTYAWVMVSRPADSLAVLSAADAATTSFTPDKAGLYALQLTTSDGQLTSPADEVIVNATTGNIVLSLDNPGLIGVGRQNTLRIALTAPAPTGGVTVNVASDDPSVVAVTTASVPIAGGQTQAQVQVLAIAPGSTVIRATAPTYAAGSVPVSVTSRLITLPTAQSAAVGITAAVPISIGPDAAPAGGVAIAITSSDPATLQVLTPTVTVSAGAFSTTASVRGLAGGTVTLVATNADYATATSQVTSTGSLNIIEGSVTMTPGFPGTLTVQLESNGSPIIVPPPGLVVTLVAANPSCLAVPSTIMIPAGQTSVQQALAHGGTATLPCTTTVTATANGLTSDSSSVTVNPNPGITVSAPTINTAGSFPRYVGAGLQDGTYAVSLGASNHGGVSVRVTSNNPAVALVSPNATTPGTAFVDLPVANGATSTSFFVQGMEGQVGAVTVTASAPGFTATTTGVINVVTPAVSLRGSLTSTTTALSTDSPFTVSVGPPSADGSDLRVQSGLLLAQAVRAGGTPLTVTVTSSTPSVGLVKSLSGAAASVTALIGVGSGVTANGVAAGGVAFDPETGGTTTVTGTIPGFLSTTAAARLVTVSAPGITISAPIINTAGSFPRYVGAGLQDGMYAVSLGASNHGGVTVRVTSSDQSVALVSPNATTPGTAFLDLPVANGAASTSFYVQGLEGQVGAVTVTASAPGFTATTTGVINVVTPAVSLRGSLTSTTTALSTDSPFTVSVGPPSADGSDLRVQSGLILAQAVRAGGMPLTVTVTSSTPSVGLVKSLSGAAASVTALIGVGSGGTANGVAAGGVAFDPQTGGTTTVTGTIPGLLSTTAAARLVTVSAPGITISAPTGNTGGTFPRYVGAGLQDGAYSVSLGASNHGGVSVRVTSSDPAVALVSPNATTPGTAFVDLPVANGATSTSFYVQGLEGQVGSVTVTASALGFTGTTTGVINVVTPAVSLRGSLAGTTTALSIDSPFTVSVGPPAADGSDLRVQSGLFLAQAVRTGGTPLTVTLTSDTPGVGLLATVAGTAASRSVVIGVRQSQTASSVAAGGVAFDPVAAGSTRVSASVPGFVLTTAASRTVSVTTPGIVVNSPNGISRIVGAGLQDGPYSVNLQASNHGGTTVRITSSDPTRLQVAPSPTTAGSDFIELPLTNGSTNVVFYVQGVENQTGVATVDVSAPNFTSATTGTITVAPAAYRIASLPSTLAATASTTTFFVEVGVANADSSDLLIQGTTATQAVRPGNLLTTTVSNSNAVAAQLISASGGAQSWAVNILPGQSRTASSTGTGGIAFDPLSGACTAAGCDTVVDANLVGLVKVATATRVVRVTP